MQRENTEGRKGRVIIAAITGFSILLGNMAAKEADYLVNQMFSKNAEVVRTEDVEIIEGTDISFDDEYQYAVPSKDSVYTEFELLDTADKTYEIIYGGEPPIMGSETTGAEHTHILSDMNIKEHISSTDGSCITTQFEGRICTVCESVWKGNRIRTSEFMKCIHMAE